jgi:hypothetical protein
MGSIFKPSTTVVQAPQQSTTTYDIPAYFKEIQEKTLRRADVESQQPFQAYTGQRIAPLTATEQQAGDIYSQQILPQAGQLAAIGAQTFTPAMAQQYMNPYENQVVTSALGDVERAYQGQQRALSSQAIGSGAFGGGREGVQRGVLGGEYLRQVGDVSGRLRQAGFESGAQRFAADRASQLGSAQAQLASLAGASSGLAQFGGQERGIQQAGLTEAFRDFVEEQGFEQNQINQVIGALAGAPIRSYGEERTGYTSQVVGAPSPFGQIMGAAGAIGSLPPGTFSDIALKDNINLIGKSPSGINIYTFTYKGDDKVYQGVMAHEVPHASSFSNDGYLMVDYSKVDVEFKKVN